VAEVAALSMDTVAKLVAAAGAGQARPLLPDLVPPLLESLSTMEARSCLCTEVPAGVVHQLAVTTWWSLPQALVAAPAAHGQCLLTPSEASLMTKPR